VHGDLRPHHVPAGCAEEPQGRQLTRPSGWRPAAGPTRLRGYGCAGKRRVATRAARSGASRSSAASSPPRIGHHSHTVNSKHVSHSYGTHLVHGCGSLHNLGRICP
jgi:hypothetical protein